MFGKSPEGIACKYAGEWERDQIHGDGHYVYPDGSEYKGNFVKGKFNGVGMFWWPVDAAKGHAQKNHYKGEWLEGKMNGKGQFTHALGHSYKGYFSNNLFEFRQDGKTFFVNPFETKGEHQAFIKSARASVTYLQKQEELKNETIQLRRAGSLNQLHEHLAQCKASNRTALLLSSSEAKIVNSNVFESLQNDGSADRQLHQLFLKDLALECEAIPFDARQAYLENQHQFNGGLLHNAVTGEVPG